MKKNGGCISNDTLQNECIKLISKRHVSAILVPRDAFVIPANALHFTSKKRMIYVNIAARVSFTFYCLDFGILDTCV